MSRKIRVVLFDLDGTLVKAGGCGRKALDRAVLALYGVREVCSRFSLAGRTDKENFALAYKHATGRAASQAVRDRIERAYLRRLPSEVRRAVRERRYQKIGGVHELLRSLARDPDVLVGLGTGNVERGARLKLAPSGLLKYFAFGGYGSDGVSRVAMLRAAVRRAAILAGRRIAPGSVFVIGDTARDVLAARRAGYHAGVVSNGFGDLGELKRSRPDILRPDFRDGRAWRRWLAG